MPLLHVPLVVFFPRQVPAGRQVADPISLRDLPATILELSGNGGKGKVPGYSLACHWISELPPGTVRTSAVLSEVNVAPIRPGRYPTGASANMRSILQEPLHYIRNANGREELYDIVKDPAEETNLLGEEESQSTIKQFRNEGPKF